MTVTSASARFRCIAAVKPPKPAPIMTTCVRRFPTAAGVSPVVSMRSISPSIARPPPARPVTSMPVTSPRITLALAWRARMPRTGAAISAGEAAIGEVAFQRSHLDDWMKPVEAPVPNALAATGHRAVIYRDPYGVALIIGPFNGPLTLLLRPAIAALAAGNTCILTLSNALKHMSETLLRLIPCYFEEPAVAAVAGGREANTSLLQLPFDFIFFTGSTKVGKIVAKAAAGHLTPVLLELGGQNPAIVDGTGNIADAARKIVWGAMAWGGQWCT